jgi:hypothetical protein
MSDVSPGRVDARRIGALGTLARLVLGGVFVGSVVAGHLRAFHPLPWLVGLVVFPGLILGWQWLRARYAADRLRATGPLAHVLNICVFFALYLTPFYAPALGFTSDAALLFYGLSMLVAAARGYRGCEVLAVSNWLLRRDDQVGCLLFGPIDAVDTRRHPDPSSN